jgi:hypothetical protein
MLNPFSQIKAPKALCVGRSVKNITLKKYHYAVIGARGVRTSEKSTNKKSYTIILLLRYCLYVVVRRLYVRGPIGRSHFDFTFFTSTKSPFRT